MIKMYNCYCKNNGKLHKVKIDGFTNEPAKDLMVNQRYIKEQVGFKMQRNSSPVLAVIK